MKTLCTLLLIFTVLSGVAQTSTLCVNPDFESTAPGTYTSSSAVMGWSISSAANSPTATPGCSGTNVTWSPGGAEFFVVATPVPSVPVLGILGHSPLGGTIVAQLNDYVAPQPMCTRLSKTVAVNAGSPYFTYAFAGVWVVGSHNCCDGPAFQVRVRDCQGTMLSCLGQTLNMSCTNSLPYNVTPFNTVYSNWQISQIDLSSQAGSCVTIEFISHDCTFAGHTGVTYIDAICGGSILQQVNPPVSISYCPGGPAVLQAAPGYSSYAWGSSTATLTGNSASSTYTVNTPMQGATYQASLTSYAGCLSVQNFTLMPTQVSVTAIGASPSCSLGASGSATVQGTGSGSGYNYVWTSPASSVVSTGSVAQNLPPGTYSVQLSATNNSACGVAGTTVYVGNNQGSTHHVVKPYCSSSAYFYTNGGSGIQWYYGNTAISGTAGSVPSWTMTSPSNGAIVRLSYLSPQGCRDSIIYTLWQGSPPATVSALFNGQICQGANNGQATVSLLPTGNNQITGGNYFLVASTGTTPPFSASVNPTSSNFFPLNGLSAGGTYSVTAFDGACFASSTFSVPTFFTSSLFTVSTVGSPSLCQGQSVMASAVFANSTTPAAFTFSWSPLNFITGAGNGQAALITPTASNGASLALTYTVVVTPTHVNCPVTRTIQVVVSNPLPASISPVPPLCDNGTTLALTGSPPGGVFSGGNYVSANGVLTPSLAVWGSNPISYIAGLNNCVSTVSGTFMLLQSPTVQASGTDTVCAGTAVTLTGTGAMNYQWHGLGSGQTITASPAVSTTYVVTGTAANTCTGLATLIVNVTPVPSLTVTGNTPVCPGYSLLLKATGAQSYIWLNGPSSPFYYVTPTAPGTYTLIGVNQPLGCTDTLVVPVTLHPQPQLSVNGPYTVCSGDQLTLQGSGAPNLLWNGLVSGGVYTTTLSSAQTFTLSGTNAAGCASKTVHTVHALMCLDLAEAENLPITRIYPNPAKEWLTVVLAENALVLFYDSHGRLVSKIEGITGENLIGIAHLSAGVYTVVVSDGLTREVCRVIRQ